MRFVLHDFGVWDLRRCREDSFVVSSGSFMMVHEEGVSLLTIEVSSLQI